MSLQIYNFGKFSVKILFLMFFNEVKFFGGRFVLMNFSKPLKKHCRCISWIQSNAPGPSLIRRKSIFLFNFLIIFLKIFQTTIRGGYKNLFFHKNSPDLKELERDPTPVRISVPNSKNSRSYNISTIRCSIFLPQHKSCRRPSACGWSGACGSRLQSPAAPDSIGAQCFFLMESHKKKLFWEVF